MMVRLLKLKKAIQKCFRAHDGNARKLTTREWTIANEVCSLLDVVAEVTIKIQGGVDNHISRTMFSMLKIKEIVGDMGHWIRAPDQAYDGGDVLKEKVSLDDLTSEALKVRDTSSRGWSRRGLGRPVCPWNASARSWTPGGSTVWKSIS